MLKDLYERVAGSVPRWWCSRRETKSPDGDAKGPSRYVREGPFWHFQTFPSRSFRGFALPKGDCLPAVAITPGSLSYSPKVPRAEHACIFGRSWPALQFRITLTIGLVAFVASFAIGLYAYRDARDALVDATRERLALVADSRAEAIRAASRRDLPGISRR